VKGNSEREVNAVNQESAIHKISDEVLG
jgi:hypothetical protein